MKHIRTFSSAEIRDVILNTVDYTILHKTDGIGVGLRRRIEPQPLIDYTVPMYIENLNNVDNVLNIKSTSYAPNKKVYKSLDNITWELWDEIGGSNSKTVSTTVPANSKLYLRCNCESQGEYYGWRRSDSYYSRFSSEQGEWNIGGNIMSLIYGDTFNGQTEFPDNWYTNDDYMYTFAMGSLFKSFNVISAKNFILPATTLVKVAYSNMFQGCENLIEAPVLPATTLANNCYYQMFSYCTSLTTAPVLPAATLAQACYNGMFNGCSSLNYIKCLATNISAPACIESWTKNVASTGTFVKNQSMSDWTIGNNGIPSGWTVEDA